MFIFAKHIYFLKEYLFSILKNNFFFLKDNISNNYYEGYTEQTYKVKREKIGIIIQGPIVAKYTIFTALFYKKIYKNDEILISTDSKLGAKDIAVLKRNKINLLNYLPVSKNFANLASQGYGVKLAINFLKKKKIQYILKTRADQRFLNPLFLNNIYNWFSFFNDKKNNKILVGNFGSHLFWPYDIPDFFLFSKTEEINNFFSYDISKKSELFDPQFIFKKQSQFNNAKNHNDWARIQGGGSYMCIKYLKKKYNLKKIQFTLKKYYNYLAKDFIFIDTYSLGLIWNKYNFYIHRDHPTMFSQQFANRDISIYDWFMILKGKRVFGTGKEQYKKVPWLP
jgi:hypothetical protein